MEESSVEPQVFTLDGSTEDLSTMPLMIMGEIYYKQMFENELDNIKTYCKNILVETLKIDFSLLDDENIDSIDGDSVLLAKYIKRLNQTVEKLSIKEIVFLQTVSFGNAEVAGLITSKTKQAHDTLTQVVRTQKLLQEDNCYLNLYELAWSVFLLGQFYRFTNFEDYKPGIRAHQKSKVGGTKGGKLKHANERQVKEAIHQEITTLAIKIYTQDSTKTSLDIAADIHEAWRTAENHTDSLGTKLYKLREAPYEVEYIQKSFKMKNLKSTKSKKSSSP